MDINQSSLSLTKLNKPGIARTAAENKALSEALKTNDTQSSQSVSSAKQLDLKEGQVVKGQILDHRYNEIRVQLEPSKQVVTAKLSGDVPLSIGQEALFQVTEDSTERLVLKYIPENATATDTTVQKALTASGFPMTERNKAIVWELLNHTMPVDKQTLQTLIKLSHTNREASPLTLVLMYKNNIPMTAANIKQFEAYQNGTGQLLKDIHSITKNISELLKQPCTDAITNNMNTDANLRLNTSGKDLNNSGQLFTNTTASETSVTNLVSNAKPSVQEILQINNKLVDIIYGSSTNTNNTNNTNNNTDNTATMNTTTMNTATINTATMNTATMNTTTMNTITMNTATMNTMINEMYSQDGLTLLNNIPEQDLVENAPLTAGLSSEIKMNLLEQIKDGSIILSNLPDSIETVLESYTIAQDSPLPISNILNPQEQASLVDLLRDCPSTETMKSQLSAGTANVKELLTFLQNNLPQMEEDTARKLLTSPEYQKLLEGAFHEKWTLTPEKLANKSSVNELYQNLQEDVEKLSSLTKIAHTTNEAQSLQEPVKNLQENLHFMKDLNEMFTYLPLPVQLKNQDIHSDLYVFTRKKALQEKENLSVLLHLDMTNLGAMNIHIQMNRNMIQAKFYMDNSGAEQLFAEYMPALSGSLSKKGYNLHSEVTGSYEKPDFSKDFLEESAIDNEVRRYTFDIRT